MQLYLKLVLLTLFVLSVIECQTALLQRVLNSLEKALNFVYEDCKDLNVDGVFGVVLAEGPNLRILWRWK